MALPRNWESHSVEIHAIMGLRTASNAGPHRATASLAVMDLPEIGAMARAAACRNSFTTFSLGSAVAAPYNTEGCMPVRKT